MSPPTTPLSARGRMTWRETAPSVVVMGWQPHDWLHRDAEGRGTPRTQSRAVSYIAKHRRRTVQSAWIGAPTDQFFLKYIRPSTVRVDYVSIPCLSPFLLWLFCFIDLLTDAVHPIWRSKAETRRILFPHFLPSPPALLYPPLAILQQTSSTDPHLDPTTPQQATTRPVCDEDICVLSLIPRPTSLTISQLAMWEKSVCDGCYAW